jgi:DNA-directed RNA polymerase specialized sigma24 family protein
MVNGDEDRLAQLLDQQGQRAGQDEDLAKRSDAEIAEIVYRHLYQALRPQMLARYGAAVNGRYAGTRFTELLNEFFVRVLDRFPDLLARTRSARQLRSYVSRALTNLMIDRSRRATHERTCDDDLLGCLVEERQQHLNRECPGMRYEAVLDALAAWAAGSPQQQQMAEIIRREFVSGDRAEDIGRDLEISKSEFYRRRAAALAELSRTLG